MSLSYQQNNYSGSQGETKKIFCAYHRTEFLTNFCLQKQCLMPLCPSCVAEHTEEHYRNSQKPTYINLNDGLYEVKQKCYSYIVSLQEYNKKNQQLLIYINNLTRNIHGQLDQIKQQIYIKIEQAFNRYEYKIIKQAEDYYRNNVVYDLQEAETIKQYIGQRIQILYDKIGMLKGDQCLAGLIQFYDAEQKEYQFQLKEVGQYISKHKKVGRAEISLNIDTLNQKFDTICEQLLVLSYVSDYENHVVKNSMGINKKRSPSVAMTPQLKQKQAERIPILNQTVRNSGIRNKGLQSRFKKID